MGSNFDLSDVVFTLVVYNISLDNMDNQDLPDIYAHSLRLGHIIITLIYQENLSCPRYNLYTYAVALP